MSPDTKRNLVIGGMLAAIAAAVTGLLVWLHLRKKSQQQVNNRAALWN